MGTWGVKTDSDERAVRANQKIITEKSSTVALNTYLTPHDEIDRFRRVDQVRSLQQREAVEHAVGEARVDFAPPIAGERAVGL